MEEWRDIEEFKGLYQVSNLGRVRSLPRTLRSGKYYQILRTYPSKIMTQYEHKTETGVHGMRVHLRVGKKNQVQRSVGKLVLLAFVGEPPKPAKQVKHLDGNPKNNKLDNLAWDVNKSYGLQHNEENRMLFELKAYSYVWLFVKNETYLRGKEAEDFVQECLIKIWMVIDLYNKDHCKFISFCWKKCRWFLNAYLRKKYNRERISKIESVDGVKINGEDLPIDKNMAFITYD